MTDLRKAAERYTRPGAIVPVDIDTTRFLVDALRQALAQPVDAVNMSQERVDETAKRKHEWVGLTVEEARKLYEKYTNREELIYAIDEFLEEKNT